MTDDPTHFGFEFIMELPAEVIRLHKEEDELWAVLANGSTIRLTDLLDDEKPKQ